MDIIMSLVIPSWKCACQEDIAFLYSLITLVMQQTSLFKVIILKNYTKMFDREAYINFTCETT
jgi:hypothetical protein